jgi:hypothetical protein
MNSRGISNLRDAWDEIEKLCCSFSELTNEEIVDCKEDLHKRAKAIRNSLKKYLGIMLNINPERIGKKKEKEDDKE